MGEGVDVAQSLPRADTLTTVLRDIEGVAEKEASSAEGRGDKDPSGVGVSATVASPVDEPDAEAVLAALRVEEGDGMEGTAVPDKEGEPEGEAEYVSGDAEGGWDRVPVRVGSAEALPALEAEGETVPLRDTAEEEETDALPEAEREAAGERVGSAPDGVAEPEAAREPDPEALPTNDAEGALGEAVESAEGKLLRVSMPGEGDCVPLLLAGAEGGAEGVGAATVGVPVGVPGAPGVALLVPLAKADAQAEGDGCADAVLLRVPPAMVADGSSVVEAPAEAVGGAEGAGEGEGARDARVDGEPTACEGVSLGDPEEEAEPAPPRPGEAEPVAHPEALGNAEGVGASEGLSLGVPVPSP